MTGKLEFDLRKVWETVTLENGTQVHVIDSLARRDLAEDEASRNIFAFAEGHMVWRVRSKFDTGYSGPFTRVYCRDGKLYADRWDGGEYDIDALTGFATPGRFLK